MCGERQDEAKLDSTRKTRLGRRSPLSRSTIGAEILSFTAPTCARIRMERMVGVLAINGSWCRMMESARQELQGQREDICRLTGSQGRQAGSKSSQKVNAAAIR